MTLRGLCELLQPPIDLNVGSSAGAAPSIRDPRATGVIPSATTQPASQTEECPAQRQRTGIWNPELAKNKGKGVKVRNSTGRRY